MTKRDLLRKLQSVRNTERGIVPDAEFVLRTREKLLLQVRNTLPLAPEMVPVRSTFSFKHLFPERVVNLVRAPALAMFSVFVTVFGGSILSVSASDRSLPGDFLYPIKIATEQTRLALTSGKTEKLRLKTEFVDRRVEEIKVIASTPVPEKPVRLKQAAEVLKRDLNTMKLQLSEVKNEVGPEAAAAVRIVDEKSVQIAEDLKQVKSEAPVEVKNSLAEAEVAAVHTGVTAVEVLLEVSANPDTQWVVSEADVRESISKKVETISASLSDSADKLRSVSASSTILPNQMQATGTGDNLLLGMTSTTAEQLNTASTTLQEARVLLNENKLIEVSGKLLEAVKAVAQAETAADQLVASSTQAIVTPIDIAPSNQASSTAPVSSSSTGTANTATTSTGTTPP